jgi:hypothetical protein
LLYLHIGTGKAGSTTIQTFLKSCGAELPYSQLESFGLGNSWKIAASTGTERSRWYWVEHIKRLDADEYQRLCSRFWTEVKSEVASLENSDFVASSEFIYGQVACDQEAMARLQLQLTEIFGEVKLLVYFRNQIDFVKSFYAQTVKGPTREILSYDVYIKNLKKIQVPIHYAERLKLWGEVFGWENVEAVVFDRKNFPNGNLIEDFCSRTGIEYDNERFAIHRQESNISPSYNHLVAFRYLNRLTLRKHKGLAVRAITSLARRAITSTLPDKEFPKEYDDLLLSKVSEGNKWLNKVFFSDLAVKLPEIN